MSTRIQRDWGTAMAFVGYDGEVDCNPPARQTIDARALLLVCEGREPGAGEMKAALAAIVQDAEPVGEGC